MPIKTRQRHLIKVDEPYGRDAATSKRSTSVTADAATADNDDEGRAEGLKALRSEEDAVAGELLENQGLGVGASTSAGGEGGVVLGIGVGVGGEGGGAAVFVVLYETTASPAASPAMACFGE
ncbi:MAG: hypothetical protein Q9157_008889 [Trypethelium eluteriae]